MTFASQFLSQGSILSPPPHSFQHLCKATGRGELFYAELLPAQAEGRDINPILNRINKDAAQLYVALPGDPRKAVERGPWKQFGMDEG